MNLVKNRLFWYAVLFVSKEDGDVNTELKMRPLQEQRLPIGTHTHTHRARDRGDLQITVTTGRA